MTDKCDNCGGKGYVTPAMDLLARPPREQAKYERRVKEMALCCPVCLGSGEEPGK